MFVRRFTAVYLYTNSTLWYHSHDLGSFMGSTIENCQGMQCPRMCPRRDALPYANLSQWAPRYGHQEAISSVTTHVWEDDISCSIKSSYIHAQCATIVTWRRTTIIPSATRELKNSEYRSMSPAAFSSIQVCAVDGGQSRVGCNNVGQGDRVR